MSRQPSLPTPRSTHPWSGIVAMAAVTIILTCVPPARMLTTAAQGAAAQVSRNDMMVMVLMDNLLDPTLPAIDAGARRRGDAEWKDDILDRILPGRSVSTNEALHRVMTRRSFFALVDDSPIGQQDIDNAVADIAAAAEEGDAEAQYSMGVLHGAVVSGEDASRVEWYRHAAAQGHAAAQASLGASYFIGLGVQQNYTEGLRWLLRSARQGYVRTQHTLGALYEHEGLGLDKDCAEAVRWYRLAAAQGYDVPEHMRPADTAKRCSRSALRGGAAGGSPTVAGVGRRRRWGAGVRVAGVGSARGRRRYCCGRRRGGVGSNNRGYVNRDPVPARSPVRGWGGYFLAAFFLRSAQ